MSNEKEVKSQIEDWLIDVLGQTDITNNSLNELVDNEYDNFIMKRDYEKRIAELEREVLNKDKEIDALKFIQRNTTSLIEKVSEQGQKHLRHEICEKIREKIGKRLNGITNSSYSEAYKDGCYRIVSDVNDFLDQVEGEKDDK